MAFVFPAASNGGAPILVPTGGPPGLRGPGGADSTAPGPEGPPGRPGQDGGQGPAGAGAITSKQASVNIDLWTAVVAVDATRCRPADPNNPAHRGQVIGITAYGGVTGAQVEIQNVGDLMGAVATFTNGMPLFIGEGGKLTPNPPTSGWRQTVGAAVSSSQIVIALGEASFIDDGADAMLDEGGFSTPCPLDRAADPTAGGYVTPAANARAFSAMLCGPVPAGLPPRRGQFLVALEARQAGSLQTLLDALPSDPADPINVAWFHTVGVVGNGRLAQFAKLTLSLTDAQLAAAIVSARSIIE